MFDTRTGLPRTLIETPRGGIRGSTVHVRLEREALPAVKPPHLLLRFESNGSHRHRRVAPSFRSARPAGPPGDPVNTPAADPPVLRRELRARRRAITGARRIAAAQRVALHADAAGLLRPGRRIGLYVASTEELDSAPLMARARTRGCRIHLPRITSVRHARMQFVAAGGPLRAGPWGMLQPAGGAVVRARELDLVFLPLVGFDDAGHRIGMGKGFYDRHFTHRRWLRGWRVPLLIGIAYEIQRVPRLTPAPHDVPLDGIVTERSFTWLLEGAGR